LILRIFFPRIEISNIGRVPARGPVILVVNHPNGLIDPLFLLCLSPRPVSFLAKAPLFDMPVIGWFVKTLGSIPVYRRQDEGRLGGRGRRRRRAGAGQDERPDRQRGGDRRWQFAANNPGHGRAKDDADGWNIRRGQDAHHVGDLPQPNGHGDAAGAFEKAVERHTPWRVPPGINHSDASMLARR